MSPRSLCDGQSAHPSLPRADAVEVVAKPALVAIDVGHGLCTIPISVTTTHSQQSFGAAYLRRTRTADRNRRLSRFAAEQEDVFRRRLLELAQQVEVVRRFAELPGIGWVRAATLFVFFGHALAVSDQGEAVEV